MKTTVEGLADALHELLEEYGDDIARQTAECVQKAAKEGAKALRDASPKKTGEYAKGWTSKVEKGRLYAKGVIYNKKPGLPHLLEHGHTVRSWGRTWGRTSHIVHIKPVEEQITESFGKAIGEIK